MNGNEDVPIILEHLFESCHDPSLLLVVTREPVSNVPKE